MGYGPFVKHARFSEKMGWKAVDGHLRKLETGKKMNIIATVYHLFAAVLLQTLRTIFSPKTWRSTVILNIDGCWLLCPISDV